MLSVAWNYSLRGSLFVRLFEFIVGCRDIPWRLQPCNGILLRKT